MSARLRSGSCVNAPASLSGLLRIHGPHRIDQTSPLAHSNSLEQMLGPESNQELLLWSQSAPDIPAADMRVAYHGDMKASNTIMFSNHQSGQSGDGGDDWTLKIADFGMAGFQSRRGGTSATARTPTYAAPEYRIRDAPIRESACDIWALGCMYLEFIAWYFGGWSLLESFVERR
jgi:serine/threonine protein kinase